MNQLFDGLDNVFGALKPDIRARLQAVIDNPNRDNWDDAFSIILRGDGMLTLWQAVIEVDPTFPRSGKRTDQKGKVLQDWARIPDRDTLLKAILLATKGGVNQ